MPVGRVLGIGTALDAVGRALVRVPQTAPLEVARGMNDGGDQVATVVRHALQDQLGVNRYAVAAKAVKTVPAAPERLRYDIWSSRGGLPIRDFPMSASPAGVTAHVWGVDKTFQRSFVTSSKGYTLARVGQARYPVRALFGPAPYKELLRGETLKAFDRAVPLLVEPLVLRRVMALLP